MEEQTNRHSSSGSHINSSPRQPSFDEPASSSLLTLRFPRPEGSRSVANWVSASSTDIMASPTHPNEDSGLSDSTFELINNPETSDSGHDSQEDHIDSMSESLSEYERYPNADEVQAFSGLDDMSTSAASMATDSDSEDEEVSAAEQSIPPLVPADSDRLGEESASIVSSADRTFPLAASLALPSDFIEFSEPEDVDVHIDKISVKHTIKEFSEAEAYEFFKSLGRIHGDIPQRVSATIRQTMSQRCLSTHEAFRLLYVGDYAPRNEIILKISRAITCSSAIDYNENKTLRRNTQGVYNIVPVTFGTDKDRDVELMEASGFQIKVDTCLDAEKIPIDSSYFRDDIIYSLTVDGGNSGKKYKSVPAAGPEGAQVQPTWTLPHVAVFFCAEYDDNEMRRIQTTAWEFCRRHGIPTLFISDHPVFASPVADRWINYTNEHAVCLSLESRGGETEQRTPMDLRFPIDLHSFLNIDNRQMNQNLAYLTGLQKPVAVADEKLRDVVPTSESGCNNLPSKSTGMSRLSDFLRVIFKEHLETSTADQPVRPNARSLVQMLSVAICLLGIILAIFPGSYTSTGVSVREADFPTMTGATPATATVTVSHTSTKTVKVPNAETPSFGGFLSDIAHSVSSDVPKSISCSIELLKNSEILVRMPFGTKEAWLAKGAIVIEVFRGSEAAPITSRLSSTDEGILVQLPDEEKHGVVTLSIVTTRYPKLNVNYPIDLGTPMLDKLFGAAQDTFHALAQKISEAADETLSMIEDNYGPVLTSADQQIKDQAVSWWNSIKEASKKAQDYTSAVAGETYDRVKDSVHPSDAAPILKDVQRKLAGHLRHVEDARDEGELAILKAQIASRLWWLKIQGKKEEHREYERQARLFMTKRHSESVLAKKARDAKAEATKCPRTGSKPCHCKKGLGRWSV